MAAHQAPPSLGFSRQEHWSGLPFPSPMYESEQWKWSRSGVSDAYQPHGLYSLPGSSVHGICQARVLEWVAIAFSWFIITRPHFLSTSKTEKSKKYFINKKYYCLNHLKTGKLAILINFTFSPNDKFNYKVSMYYRYLLLFNAPFDTIHTHHSTQTYTHSH